MVTVGFIGLFVSQCDVALAEDSEGIPSLWHYQLYADVGYASSDNNPGNHEWRSKSTTSTLDSFELFLGLGSVRKDATEDSRWGLELGCKPAAIPRAW